MTKDARDSSWPDELVPSQWSALCAPDFFDLPERRLLVAVLMDALRVLRQGNLKQQHGVITWIRGHEARLTFQDVCEGLELNPRQVASQMLHANRDAPVPRRARWSRKGQSAGRHHRRVAEGAAETASVLPTPAEPVPTVVPFSEVEPDTERLRGHG